MKRGEFVYLVFLDHVEDGDEPIRCHVIGRLESAGSLLCAGDGKRRRYVVVESWFFGDEVDEATARHNAKRFVILKSTIESCRVLR